MNNAYRMCTAWFRAEGRKYQDLRDGDRPVIRVGFHGGDNLSEMGVQVIFDANEKSVAIRGFNLVKVPKDKIAEVMFACNELNSKFRWTKFYVDTSDMTVSAEDDAVIDLDTVGSEVFELCARMYNICDDAYPILMKAIYA